MNRWSGAPLWTGDADSRRQALEQAAASRADLRGADLTGADLTPIRDDLWAVLSAAPAEVPALLATVREGRINGSAYEGACACLVGTIANARHCLYTELGTLQANASRPSERFFLSIRPGDTPATNQASALVEEWIVDWLIRMRLAFGPAPVVTDAHD